jgi:hypothetical protein
MPPDACVEISLWDRFGWGPEDTDRLTLAKIRIIFAVMEQQRVTKDAVEELGRPDEDRVRSKVQAMNRAKEEANQRAAMENQRTADPSNARVTRRELNKGFQ